MNFDAFFQVFYRKVFIILFKTLDNFVTLVMICRPLAPVLSDPCGTNSSRWVGIRPTPWGCSQSDGGAQSPPSAPQKLKKSEKRKKGLQLLQLCDNV